MQQVPPRTSTSIVPSAKSLPSIHATPGPSLREVHAALVPGDAVASRLTALSLPPASRSARSICVMPAWALRGHRQHRRERAYEQCGRQIARRFISDLLIEQWSWISTFSRDGSAAILPSAAVGSSVPPATREGHRRRAPREGAQWG